MQTAPTAPHIPPAPPLIVVRRQWGLTAGALGLAIVTAVVSALFYFPARESSQRLDVALRASEAELAAVQTNLEDVESDLRSTKDALASTESELADSEALNDTLSACTYRLLRAWYGTLANSYTITGIALHGAVRSRACAVPRSAYEQVN